MAEISIIIPVYNADKYLKKCIQSMLNQSFKDIEIICINDGSTDNSLQILETFAQNDERLIILNQQNSGPAKARNNGLSHASGKYIMFCDSDDWYEADMCGKMYSKIQEKDYDLVMCDCNIHIDDTVERAKNIDHIQYHYLNLKGEITVNDEVKKNIRCLLWNKIFKKDLIDKYNISFPDGYQNDDNAFIYQYTSCLQKTIYGLDEKLYNYVIRNNSIMDKELIVGNSHALDWFYSILFVLKNLKKQKLLETNVNWLLNTLKNAVYFRWQFLSKRQKDKALKLLNMCMQAIPEKYIKKDEYKLLQYIKNKKYLKAYTLLDKKEQLNFIEKIFSIKNSYDKRHKIITIFGINIKLRKNNLLKNIFTVENIDIYKVLTILGIKFRFIRPLKQYEQEILNQYINHSISYNTVLLIEANNCHGETLPGIAKYFLDSGCKVECFLTNSEYNLHPFCKIKSNNIICNPLEKKQIWYLLNNCNFVNQYKYIFFNSEYLVDPITKKQIAVTKYFPLGNLNQKNIIYLNHAPNKYKDNTGKNLILAPLPVKDKDKYKVVNSHYFGDVAITGKNDITNFIVIGNIEDKRKNHNLLLDSIGRLLQQGVNKFRITVIARTGNLDSIPEDIRPFIDFKGRLDYPQMYNELEKADFFLTLLDPDNPEHDRYITTGTSGSFQLIYGFAKPCLINKKFAALHGFNDENSIIYEKNSDFTEALKKAIDMSASDYNSMQNSLKIYADNLYQTSLKNLKNIL